MRRREFVAGLTGAAAWPLAVRAQQPTSPVIGFINGTSPEGYGPYLARFLQGLSEIGYVDGQNVTIEYRWAEGRYDQLPALAADLVRRGVTVIAATTTPANIITKEATATIPIVFTTSSDPIEVGLVNNLSRPGRNVTGAVTLNVELGPKRLELLHEVVPTAAKIAVLVNPENRNLETEVRDLREVGRSIGNEIFLISVTPENDIEAVFASLVQQRAGAVLINTDAFLFSRRDQLVEVTRRYSLPAIFDRREFTVAGGLMSYGGDVTEVYRLAGTYVGRILKGEKPGDLPVQQSSKVDLVINLKTARTLGITVPEPLLRRADEVIE